MTLLNVIIPVAILFLWSPAAIDGSIRRVPLVPVRSQHSWQPEELLEPNYNKLQPPPSIEGQPLEVLVGLNVSQIFGVNEADQTINLRATLVEKWLDTRINYPSSESMDKISMTTMKEKLWLATTFFSDAVETVSNDNAPLLLEVSRQNHVQMTRRLLTKLNCDMDLVYFPHDTQTCSIVLESLSDITSRVNYTWSQFSIINLESAKLRVTMSNYGYCESDRGNEYSCLKATFTVERRLPYYLIRVYGPSFMIVMTNFMGFWLPVQGLPARTLLIVLPLLALVTQQTTVYAEIVVSYVVALHIWFIVCELFIFMALFELAFALIYCRSVEQRKESKADVSIGGHKDIVVDVHSNHKLRTSGGPGHMLDVHDLERHLGLGKKFKYDLTKPDGHNNGSEHVPSSPHPSDRSFGPRNSLTASHMIKTALNHVYGNVDWGKRPQDQNKVDYVSRILFPVMFFFFVALYAIALH